MPAKPNLTRLLHSVTLIGALLCLSDSMAAQSLDTELATLADNLAKQIKESGLKKISVVDFSDLQGNYNELGRFIAEHLTVNMVTHRKDFSMVDRANLKRLLEEHKLSMSGLVDPANAKKLGQISGLDAIIIGNVTPLKTDVSITAKIISTGTAEIVGAGRGSVRRGEEIDQLLDRGIATSGENSSATPSSGTSASAKKEFSASATVQKFRDFEVQLLSFKVLPNGTGFAALQINNTSKQSTICFAANVNKEGSLGAKILDDRANFVRASRLDGLPNFNASGFGQDGFSWVVGVSLSSKNVLWTKNMVELRASESQRFTIEFGTGRNSYQDESPKLGTIFKLQAELITVLVKDDDRPTPRLENIYFENITVTPASTQPK